MKIVKENSNPKYSEMLLALLKPYMSVRPDIDEIDQLLKIGIIGWNMALTKATGFPGFNQLLNETLKTSEINKKEKELVKQIIAQKNEQYAAYTNFIEGFEINEDNNGMANVSVFSKPFDRFLNDIMDDNENLEELQYQEGFINRNAILIKPKPAFWDWFKQHEKDFKNPLPHLEHTIYLIKEKDTDRETNNWLKKNFDRIFTNELESWIRDPDFWPKKRTYKMFTDFFEIEFHSMIMDLESEPVIKD